MGTMKSISKIILAYILIYKLERISTYQDSEYVEPSSPFYTKKPITLNLFDRRTTAQIHYTNDKDTNTHTFVPKDGYELWEVVFVGPQLREFGEQNTWRSENSSTTALKVVERATEDKDAQVEIYLKDGSTISFFTYTVNEQPYDKNFMLKTTTIHQKTKTNNGYKIVTVNRTRVGKYGSNLLIVMTVTLLWCLITLFTLNWIFTKCKNFRLKPRCAFAMKEEDN